MTIAQSSSTDFGSAVNEIEPFSQEAITKASTGLIAVSFPKNKVVLFDLKMLEDWICTQLQDGTAATQIGLRDVKLKDGFSKTFHFSTKVWIRNKVVSRDNARSVMNQVRKMVSGVGITYHHWSKGSYFKQGVKIHLGMNLNSLYDEAVEMEENHGRDLGKSSKIDWIKIICSSSHKN